MKNKKEPSAKKLLKDLKKKTSVKIKNIEHK